MSRSRHISRIVRITPCLRQRRPEVETRAGRQIGAPRSLRRRENATSSISGMYGKAPAAAKAARDAE